MAHQSLYRTHRPSTFADVIGQEHITKPLKEAASSKKIGHAYLFAGSRGLGKTSVARIFAEAIGCKENDLHEIDAASNNSVDGIRALTEGVYTLPFNSPYKVYILDEAHMLSKSAWNAFLKTLEEPPSYAVFILATTELEKVPETVQSRCQIFEFKKPTRAILTKMVESIAKKEGYELTHDSAELISIFADGSYRDALSVLQKVLASSEGKKLTIDDVESATGAPKRRQVHALIAALANGERGAALMAIENIVKSGADMKMFLELTLEALRLTLLIKYAPDLRESLARELDEEEFIALNKFSSSTKITHESMLAFLKAAERIRYAPIQALPLELAVLEIFEKDEK